MMLGMNYIFDFDGTLVDSLPAFIAVFNKNIRGGSNPLTAAEIDRFRAMPSRKAISKLGVRWWQVPKLILQGLPDFRALLPDLKPFDDIPEVLKELHDRGDRLFIVTSNTHDSVEKFLKLHGLEGYFTGMDTASGIFNKSKHIRNMIKVYKLKRKETVYVGDETRDIQAGKLARIKVVSVTWGFNHASILRKHRPHYLIERPQELTSIKR